MKKIICIFLAVAFVFLFCSCDPAIVDFKITKLPDKLVYVQNYDKFIDCLGGEVAWITEDGNETPGSMEGCMVDNSGVDFTREGLYFVRIYYNEKSRTFPVVVASKERLQQLIDNASK